MFLGLGLRVTVLMGLGLNVLVLRFGVWGLGLQCFYGLGSKVTVFLGLGFRVTVVGVWGSMLHCLWVRFQVYIVLGLMGFGVQG